MACGTVVGEDIDFGIDDDEATLVTQSVSVTNKSDKKEGRDKCGNVVSVAYYNKTSEIQIEGLGKADLVVGTTLSLAGTYITIAGTVFVEEVGYTRENEEYEKTSIKAMAYSGISGVS